MRTVAGEGPPITKPAVRPEPMCLRTEKFTRRGVVAPNPAAGVASYSSAIAVPVPPLPVMTAELEPEGSMASSAASRDSASI